MRSDPFYAWLLETRKEATALAYYNVVRRIERTSPSGTAADVVSVISGLPESMKPIAKAGWAAWREYLLTLPDTERPAVPDDIRGVTVRGFHWHDSPIMAVLPYFIPALPVFPLAQIAAYRADEVRAFGEDLALVYRNFAVILPSDAMLPYLNFLVEQGHEGPYLFGSTPAGTTPMDMVTLKSLLDIAKRERA